jgi:hypothetical protein
MAKFAEAMECCPDPETLSMLTEAFTAYMDGDSTKSEDKVHSIMNKVRPRGVKQLRRNKTPLQKRPHGDNSIDTVSREFK